METVTNSGNVIGIPSTVIAFGKIQGTSNCALRSIDFSTAIRRNRVVSSHLLFMRLEASVCCEQFPQANHRKSTYRRCGLNCTFLGDLQTNLSLLSCFCQDFTFFSRFFLNIYKMYYSSRTPSTFAIAAVQLGTSLEKLLQHVDTVTDKKSVLFVLQDAKFNGGICRICETLAALFDSRSTKAVQTHSPSNGYDETNCIPGEDVIPAPVVLFAIAAYKIQIRTKQRKIRIIQRCQK